MVTIKRDRLKYNFLLFGFIFFSIVLSKSFTWKDKLHQSEAFGGQFKKKKVILSTHDDDGLKKQMINKKKSSSITDKFHILSIFPNEVRTSGGDEVELKIDRPSQKEVYCKIGLKVFRGLNRDNETMVCKLPLLSDLPTEISLSFDQIHWCQPFPITVVDESRRFSLMALCAYAAFGIVLVISLKMIFFDKKGKSKRRRPPRKKAESYSKDLGNGAEIVFNRRIIGDSFL